MAGRKGRTRFVGIVPEFVGFVPDGIPTGDTVELAYDELEVIRLLDFANHGNGYIRTGSFESC